MKNFSVAVLIASIFMVGCNSINESEKKFVGEWVFCSKTSDFEEPMIDYADTKNFILNDDGTWNFGESKGNWGGVKNPNANFGAEQSKYDLEFKESTVQVSNHANQFERVNGSISIIGGVEVLEFTVVYTYDGNNFYQNDYGEVDSYTTKNTDEITYYFVRKSDAEGCLKLKQHFAEEEAKSIGNYVMNESIYDPFDFVLAADTAKRSRFFKGLSYLNKENRLNTKQKITLGILNSQKGLFEDANVIANSLPLDSDSLMKYQLIFFNQVMSGKRDFTVNDIKKCGCNQSSGLFNLSDVFRLLEEKNDLVLLKQQLLDALIKEN